MSGTVPPVPAEDDVRAAAAAIVRAFAANDGDAYFALFSDDATFVFHTEPARLDIRSAYEELWRTWIAEGWRVASCRSSDARVQTFPGGAVFTHTVHTAVDTPDGPESSIERETIVFRVTDAGSLVAVHEHLSPQP
ncbi:nuclear transport factor 2 family protein [Microbacterium chocolatum]|uniref:YybH family protein n=1 Tax=Microbacterium aurantiacum TaxID=162393 RepID=UPI00338DDE13